MPKSKRTCKYCKSNQYYTRNGVCDRCREKAPIIKEFAAARDRLRGLVGLEPLKLTENTKD